MTKKKVLPRFQGSRSFLDKQLDRTSRLGVKLYSRIQNTLLETSTESSKQCIGTPNGQYNLKIMEKVDKKLKIKVTC